MHSQRPILFTILNNLKDICKRSVNPVRRLLEIRILWGQTPWTHPVIASLASLPSSFKQSTNFPASTIIQSLILYCQRPNKFTHMRLNLTLHAFPCNRNQHFRHWVVFRIIKVCQAAQRKRKLRNQELALIELNHFL